LREVLASSAKKKERQGARVGVRSATLVTIEALVASGTLAMASLG
jgi:hypothetical protein